MMYLYFVIVSLLIGECILVSSGFDQHPSTSFGLQWSHTHNSVVIRFLCQNQKIQKRAKNVHEMRNLSLASICLSTAIVNIFEDCRNTFAVSVLECLFQGPKHLKGDMNVVVMDEGQGGDFLAPEKNLHATAHTHISNVLIFLLSAEHFLLSSCFSRPNNLNKHKSRASSLTEGSDLLKTATLSNINRSYWLQKRGTKKNGLYFVYLREWRAGAGRLVVWTNSIPTRRWVT